MFANDAPQWKMLAPLLVATAAAAWGLISLFSLWLSAAGLDAVQITVVRCALSVVFIGAYLLVFHRGDFAFRLRDIWMFLGTGIASIAFFNVCYFACMVECGTSLAVILLYTAPCFVVLMSALFFREKLTRRKLMALVLAFLGCLFVVGIASGNPSVSLYGVATGLGAGFGYALYSIFARVALSRYRPVTVMFYTFLFASAVLVPFSRPQEIVALGAGDAVALAVMVGLTLVSTVLPFACYTIGLRHMETGKASIMAFIEPMVALVVGVGVFHNVLSPSNMVGIVLIVVAVLLLNTGSGQSDVSETAEALE